MFSSKKYIRKVLFAELFVVFLRWLIRCASRALIRSSQHQWSRFCSLDARLYAARCVARYVWNCFHSESFSTRWKSRHLRKEPPVICCPFFRLLQTSNYHFRCSRLSNELAATAEELSVWILLAEMTHHPGRAIILQLLFWTCSGLRIFLESASPCSVSVRLQKERTTEGNIGPVCRKYTHFPYTHLTNGVFGHDRHQRRWFS